MKHQRSLALVAVGLVLLAPTTAYAGTISSSGPPAFSITIPDGWTDNPGNGEIANVMDGKSQRGFILGAKSANVNLADTNIQKALSKGVTESGGYPVTYTWIGTGPSPTFLLDTKFAIKNVVYNARYYYLEDSGYLYCLTILSVSANPQNDADLKIVLESFSAGS